MKSSSNRLLSTWQHYTFEQDDLLFPNQHQITLIDDDPVFQAIMSYQAELDQIPLYCLSAFDKHRDISLLRSSDIIILDYELSGIEAPDLIEHFHCLSITVPILLISQRPRNEELLAKLENVRRFVSKSIGYAAILKAAKKIVQERTIDFFA